MSGFGGYGCGYGSGYGCGSGYGSGFGDGYGYGSGYIDEHSVLVVWPGYLRIGCQVHSLEHWREHWQEIAAAEDVSVSEDAAEEILSAAEAVTMEQVQESWEDA